ncbi:hypothetical protein ABZT02_07180 [Streptomyces sp. NPDC005402]|uniref:hypothetical protein n=1 Tax=Streptomyces sp. NPDC005402 TaxID=3155338 RepID=UPI0033AE9928
MATQIIVTLITALGGLLCALVASRRKSSRDVTTEFVGEQLKNLTDYSARVRHAAKIAYHGCKDNMRLLRRVGSVESAEADRVFRAFDEQLSRSDNGKIDTTVHEHFRTYDRFVEEFRDRLGTLCERLAKPHRVTDSTRLQWLESDLNRLWSLLGQLDEQFQFSINGYLSGPGAVLPSSQRRRLLRDMERFYRRRGRADRTTVDSRPEEPPGAITPSAAPEGGVHPRDRNDSSPTPCGHCVWRCPHAPVLPGADDVSDSGSRDASALPVIAPDADHPALGAGAG